MKWEPGRQGTGYFKLKLYSFWRMDCYLLKYPPGSHVPVHSDPIQGRRHLRANVLLKGEDAFAVEDKGEIVNLKRLKVFWSDCAHLVIPVKRDRMVLSFGVAI